MEFLEFEGKTTEEAIENAAAHNQPKVAGSIKPEVNDVTYLETI